MNEMVAADRRVRINGEALRTALFGAVMSQAALAQRVGVSQPTVWSWCHGGGTTARNLAAVASVLNADPAILSPDWIADVDEAPSLAPTTE